MSFTITSLYGGILGIIYGGLSYGVSKERQKAAVSLGDGTLQVCKEIAANPTSQANEKKFAELTRAIRTHGNFAEYIPMIITLLGFLEARGFPAMWIHIFGSTAVLGRLLHLQGMYGKRNLGTGRVLGAVCTYSLLFSLSGIHLYKSATQLFA